MSTVMRLPVLFTVLHFMFGGKAAPQLAWNTVHYIPTKLPQSTLCPKTCLFQHQYRGTLLPSLGKDALFSNSTASRDRQCACSQDVDKTEATALASTKRSVLLHITNHIARLHLTWEVAAVKSTHKEAHTLLLVQA